MLLVLSWELITNISLVEYLICFQFSMFFNMLFPWDVSRGNCQAQRNLSAKFLPRKIYRWIKSFLNKLHVANVVELTATKKELILVLPYLGQQPFGIQSRPQCCLTKNAPVFNLKVVFQSRKRFSTLFTFKDKINKMLHSNLVYKFQCNISNDTYYGKTKCHFKVSI